MWSVAASIINIVADSARLRLELKILVSSVPKISASVKIKIRKKGDTQRARERERNFYHFSSQLSDEVIRQGFDSSERSKNFPKRKLLFTGLF